LAGKVRLNFVLCVLFAMGLVGSTLFAAEFETATVETLPDHKGQGWFWVSGMRAPNITDGRGFLFDRDGKQLGQVSTGLWFNSLVPADQRGELLSVETYFSRGTRGTRTDLVVGYDPHTLSPQWEVEIPPKRMNSVKTTGLTVLSEDERFLLVVNYTPAQSVSIVDVKTRRFISEVETPGCSVLYAGGNRDYYSICGNGGFMHLRLDEQGNASIVKRTPPLFDPVDDFLSIAASRLSDTWYFVSIQNNVYAITMTAEGAELQSKWSLVTDSERSSDWRISGLHHTAVHEATGRLFVLMHQGEPHTFEEPGTHVWVYDVAEQKKVQTIAMNDLTMSIDVSHGPEPQLLTLDMHIPLPFLAMIWTYFMEGEAALIPLAQQVVNMYDADTGSHLGITAPLPNGYVSTVKAW